MVPVMTLAVCAIAMVGLGFALTTSVTSNTNSVGKMMIDLDTNYNGFDGLDGPDAETVNKLLSPTITSEKKTDGETTVKKTLDSRIAYMYVFGNLTDINIKVEVSGLVQNEVEKVVLTIKKVNSYDGTIDNSFTAVTATIKHNDESKIAYFVDGSSEKAGFNCGTVYQVQVTSINDKTIGTEMTGGDDITNYILGKTLSFKFTAEDRATS